MFAIDKADGKLTLVEQVSTGGRTPRYFAFDPTGAYLMAANQASNTVTVFGVNADTGRLTPLPHLAHVMHCAPCPLHYRASTDLRCMRT